jgi:hypothetical protein
MCGAILAHAWRTGENHESFHSKQSVSQRGMEQNTSAERYHYSFLPVQDEPVRIMKHGIAT